MEASTSTPHCCQDPPSIQAYVHTNIADGMLVCLDACIHCICIHRSRIYCNSSHPIHICTHNVYLSIRVVSHYIIKHIVLSFHHVDHKYMYIHTYVHTYIRTYTHTQIHTHIHTHIHACMDAHIIHTYRHNIHNIPKMHSRCTCINAYMHTPRAHMHSTSLIT